MLVLGGGVLPSTSRELKSVCVSSVEAGPRSCDGGLGEAGCEAEEEMLRVWMGLGVTAMMRRV